uniref:Uncharacterized protein n=1 Tax=viral metagenome TaxID=1070528 RepID=A0A6M3X6A3_9ZZZZ
MSRPECPECDKLGKRLAEWNAIYPFMEWLQEKKIWLAHTITKREYYGACYEDEPMDTMVPIPQNLENLLYEYFEVDPAELERERRALLESLREAEA